MCSGWHVCEWTPAPAHSLSEPPPFSPPTQKQGSRGARPIMTHGLQGEVASAVEMYPPPTSPGTRQTLLKATQDTAPLESQTLFQSNQPPPSPCSSSLFSVRKSGFALFSSLVLNPPENGFEKGQGRGDLTFPKHSGHMPQKPSSPWLSSSPSD
ncbi:hypothetical protein IE53DRAFT_166979 [Violaceomyces palustris]|uniref:Uncharacterized protein n=1 Tax=Violaceomyces palustris TaxID=1673888 RepID=A0ACD0NT93_9BASI|nr:hypothetical protein IE53DRAFT_166979 [Violaceomyces palustris]